jgi:hypothetical protein
MWREVRSTKSVEPGSAWRRIGGLAGQLAGAVSLSVLNARYQVRHGAV